MAGVRCQVRETLGRLLGADQTALSCSWVSLRVLERLLGGSRDALGRLLEVSKRHLAPKTVKATIFTRFLKKSEILGVHLGDVLTSKIVFFRVPRGYPT